MKPFKQYIVEYHDSEFDTHFFSKREYDVHPDWLESHQIMHLNPTKILDAVATHNPEMDVRKNPIGTRIQDYVKTMQQNPHSDFIQPSIVGLDHVGNISFTDGRHRLAAASQLGFKSFPVLVDKRHVDHFTKYQ